MREIRSNNKIFNETVSLIVNGRTLDLIKEKKVSLLPVYRSEWSLKKFIDSAGYEKKYRFIKFHAGTSALADSVVCEFGGIMISNSDHYIRVGENSIRVFQGDIIIKINTKK